MRERIAQNPKCAEKCFILKCQIFIAFFAERSKQREVPSTMGFVPLRVTVATPDERGVPYSMMLTT